LSTAAVGFEPCRSARRRCSRQRLVNLLRLAHVPR